MSRITSAIAQHSSAYGAIAYLKEALRTSKDVKSAEAVFMTACFQGRFSLES
ncbi:hypothetical protein [uncultured Nostoc sp.]|uniref:hypothetical protein n=1 Tax=uncultured Nostoc sp. TaxID=340711 RepID=UPI0035CC7B83